MLFRVESETVNVNTISRGSGVVVVGLDVVEVRSFHEVKAVMAVELDIGLKDWVAFAIETNTVVTTALNDSYIVQVDAVRGSCGAAISPVGDGNRYISEREAVFDDNDRPARDSASAVNDNVDIEFTEERGKVIAGAINKWVANYVHVGSCRASKSINIVFEVDGRGTNSDGGDAGSGVEENRGNLNARGCWDFIRDHTTGKVFSCIIETSSFPFGISVGVTKEATEVASEVLNRFTVEGTIFEYPDEFFTRVVEAEFEFAVDEGAVAAIVDGFVTSELNLFNQIFVADLGETSAFFRVEVDVVNQN